MAHVLVVPAPAKVNLFLHIVGRRSDGYHLLESAMALVAFGDTLTLTKRDDGQIVMRAPTPGVAVESDLCVRAARALQAYSQCRFGVEIEIEKRIPMGAGLGGGSSDAATVLLALNQLWQLKLNRATLMEIGLALGADVPFFIFGRAAIARGIGEKLSSVSLPAAQILLAMPDVHVPTPSIFAQTSLKRDCVCLDRHALALSDGENVLQPVAEALHPQIAALRQRLGPRARMSGSGAAIFLLYPPHRVTDLAKWHVHTRILPRHPLLDFA